MCSSMIQSHAPPALREEKEAQRFFNPVRSFSVPLHDSLLFDYTRDEQKECQDGLLQDGVEGRHGHQIKTAY